MKKYFKTTRTKKHILKWKSKGLSDEVIKPPATLNNNLNPNLDLILK